MNLLDTHALDWQDHKITLADSLARSLMSNSSATRCHNMTPPPATATLAPRDYRWGHAVNSPALLQDISRAIRAATAHDAQASSQDYVNAVEADVIWSETQQIAVMGHPPQTDSDLSLAAFLDEMQALAALLHTQTISSSSRSGDTTTNAAANATDSPLLIVKLDFKSMRAFEASTALVRTFVAAFPFARGVFINADILVGPANTRDIAFPDADAFVRHASALGGAAHAHKLVLSVGWTTSNANDEEFRRSYSSAMVDAMLDVLALYPDLHVTFPVRATSVQSSWPELRRLVLARPHAFGLTLWWSKTQLQDDELEWLYATLEHDPALANRTFYDILGFARFLERRSERLE